MRRRTFLLSILALAAGRARAQPARVFKVATLTTATTTSARAGTPYFVALDQRFRELGYIEGKNFVFTLHSAVGRLDKIQEVAAELASTRSDVVLATGSELVVGAIRRAVGTTPIVMLAIDFDPVERNFITSLARPGGNITGLFLRQVESAVKRLQLLAETLPEARRVAVLWDQFSRDQLKAVEESAKKLEIALLPYEMRGNFYEYEFDAPLQAAKAQKAQAVLVLSSGLFFPVRDKMIAAANAQRLPVVAISVYADAGALVAFGASISHMYRRGAEYVDRILKGAKPADLPVEQPDRYDLIVNLKTARALGIKIPQSVLLRADRVIE